MSNEAKTDEGSAKAKPVYINPALHARLKILAVNKDMSLIRLVEEGLEAQYFAEELAVMESAS